MLLFRKLHIVKSLLTAALAVPLLMSCYNYDRDEVEMASACDIYINLRIAVSTGNQNATRAGEKPAGGEDGDGREAGFVRENEVSGVTVLFYQNDAGINATDATSTKIVFCAYYSVVPISRETQGTDESPHKDEAIYTTGNRSIEGTSIDVTKKYRVMIVANKDITSSITVGTTTLAEVREMFSSNAYDGSGKGIDATNFVMASEYDPEIDFPATTPFFEGPDHYIYNFSGIRIERMAARIDFWTKYSANVAYAAATGTGTDVDGYEYQVYKDDVETTPSSTDIFKLVAVVPFNVNSGNEYYIKRTSIYENYAARSTEIPLYLENESSISWVLDYYSNAAKTVVAHPANLNNTLTVVQTLAEDDAKWLFMKDVQATYKKYALDGKDNVIVGYPMENTIDNNSPLYYYATGLAIYGYYYQNGIKDAAHTKKTVYYGYLRHQGESSGSYPAVEATELSKTETISSLGGPAMNYGVVRNNIYRIYIDRITEKETKISIKIEEEKWRHVDNPTIYI